MSDILKRLKNRNDSIQFIGLIIFSFCLVALSFFSVGFLYAQALDSVFLIKLLAIFSTANIALLFYVVTEFRRLTRV